MVLVHDTLSSRSVRSFNQIALSVQLTELTKIAFSYVYKGNNLKNKHARVMVLVHNTSSECALIMYEC